MLTRRVVPTLSSLAGVCALLVACNSTGSAPPQQTTAPASQVSNAPLPPPPTPVQVAADLPPLPPGANAAARPVEVVKAVYEFAARHPEVLKYLPCFCGCERMGHRGNDDCFVAGRDAKGHVTDWENHGMVCEVCIDIAHQAMQMHNSGASVVQIRAAIDLRYGTDSRPHTPTPKPPKGGAPED